MPDLSVWTIRFSLLYLLIGFSLGALMLANLGEPFAAWIWSLLPIHIDLLLFGFIIQFALGMGYWILPRSRSGSRGSGPAFWVAIGLLNLGIWMAGLSGGLGLSGVWLAAGRVAECAAAVLFVVLTWRRIRAF